MARVSGSLSALAMLVSLAYPVSSLALQDQAAQGTYTTAQAESGEAIYEAQCAVCHLANFQGSFEAPELAGPNFQNIWAGRPVS